MNIQTFTPARSAYRLSLICSLAFLSTGRAATLTWDGNGVLPVDGGAGTWNTTGLNWSPDGTNLQAWVNANNDDAVFGGPTVTAKTVTLQGPLTVNTLTFTTTAYTLAGATVQLGSATGTLTVDTQISAASTAIINALYTPANGTIVKNGTGLFSTGTVQTSFAGKWVVNGGILSAPGDTRLGIVPGALVPDQVTLNGGFLRSSTATVAFTANRGITLGLSGGGFDSANTTLTWAGPITGLTGGPLTKLGIHNLVLSNNTNDYTGTTFVNVGRLTAAAANALGSAAAGTEVASGAELLFDNVSFTTNEPVRIAGAGLDGGAITIQNNANVTIAGPVTLSGDATVTVSGSASGTYSNSLAFTSVANQNLTLQGGANAAGIKAVNGVINLGLGGLTKAQGGEWKLGATNLYLGPTSINAGTLTAGANGALGTADGATTVASGATLGFQGDINYSIAEAVSIAGNGVGSAGAINNLSGNNAFAGAVTLTADSRIGVTSGNLVLNGNVDGAFGLTKVGAGTLIITGTDTHSGSTTVSAGTLLVTGSISGTTLVDVAGILGGSGTIAPAVGGNINLLLLGKLSPGGAAVDTLTAGLSGGGKVDLTGGIAATNSQALLFDLDTAASSDRITINGGALEIGSGVLEFDDFAFTTGGSFAEGDYTLFSGSTAISGSLGPVTSGTLGVYTGELQFADAGTDLVLHVVPEPGSAALVLGGLGLLAGRRRRC